MHRPRLRQKGPGAGKEVEVPAYAAMQDQPRLSARMLDILMRGVSTLSVAKMTSGLNAFEISDTQEENLTPG